jgi:small subunit ribosomal protein S11
MAEKKKKTTKGRKTTKREIAHGRVYVTASFNNTLVTVTDDFGNTLCSGSAGTAGFKGTRKATPYAATVAVEQTLRRAKEELGLKSVNVYIKGPGPGRDAALRAIKSVGLHMDLIADVTPIPYNGPRAKKKRRV